jgi:signal transduction histidine kinase/CheY-like chemotaxis protein
MTLRTLQIFFLFTSVLLSQLTLADAPPSEQTNNESDPNPVPTFDLRESSWGQKQSFRLDGLWNGYWGKFLSPQEITQTSEQAIKFPVPGVWSSRPYRYVPNNEIQTIDEDYNDPFSDQTPILPALGYMTYHSKVLVPADIDRLHLYIPDMPSAYKLWVNGELSAQNGEIGHFQNQETPDFQPKTIPILNHQGQLDIVIQLSNFHYREGGIWFSLRLTDDSGKFEMDLQPIILAVFFGAILIAIGLYNFSLFAFRSKEVTALYFGLLCLTVGFRRLLIDERVAYMFDAFSWTTLQRIEHICFYLTLPLFMGFFAALYKKHIPQWTSSVSWVLTSPFLLICLTFSNRFYTELNVAFQALVVGCVSYATLMYFKVINEKGKNVKAFGASLFILILTVLHDVLKANGLVSTNNIAHFGVLAFVISQSIALQRSYLKSLDLVEAMSVQLKSRNKELIEMDAFKDEFLATTSHELRTPLQGISGLAKVLKENDQGKFTKDERNKIELIANTTKRLSILVNDILDFSSIKHGKLKLHYSRVDLNSISELVLSTMKPLIGNKNIELSADIEPDIRYLKADEFRLQQILINLMGNAVKYTEKGYIKLTAHSSYGDLIIEIDDSGVGIPNEKRQSLFRPFEQVHVDGHSSASGTGLGLSISRQLVELHGGTLDIESQVGKGTTVSMHFPPSIVIDSNELQALELNSLIRRQTAQPVNERQTPSIHHITVKKSFTPDTDIDSGDPLIFVVDDEPVNCELVSSLLSRQGYRFETFVDGLSVLARLNEKIPDLILLDFMMPRMTGVEVCQTIRKQYDSYELPVMMLTARHQIADIVSALSAGANDYLIKPYHDKELIARVHSQLSVRKYWIANKENQKLKNEIERRETLEEELSELNSRLLNVLDISDELILLVNDQLNVVYVNDKAIKTFQDKLNDSSDTSLLGQAISHFVLPELVKQLELAMTDKPKEAINVELQEDDSDRMWHASIKYFNDYGKPHLAIVITETSQSTKPTVIDASSALANLTEELSENRRKIDEIEGALRHVMSVPESPLDSQLHHDAISDSGVTVSDNDDEESDTQLPTTQHPSKELIVSLLRTSLNLWEQYTNKGKVDLAEQSRCWRVYVDGTTVKTRTFDKYLSARTIPDRPRWRAVVRTANYVLANCELKENERAELLQLTQAVEDFYT